ncbi:unnamed protein product, partial [Musa hybrid cultivar]
DKNTKTKTHQKKNFDWMGMNRNYSTILNLEPWFFPEFVLLLMHIRLNRGSYQ